MSLPRATPQYSVEDQNRTRAEIERLDRENVKRGRDIEMAAGRVFLKSPDGSRFYLSVADDGTLTAEPAP